MTDSDQGPGCRDTVLATALLVGMAAVFLALGLNLTTQDGCTGLCETAGLTLLYAGGPISALLGVLLGELPLAWPLDVTFWVVAGYLVARWAGNRDRNALAGSLLLLVAVLVYGLVLSQMVELVV